MRRAQSGSAALGRQGSQLSDGLQPEAWQGRSWAPVSLTTHPLQGRLLRQEPRAHPKANPFCSGEGAEISDEEICLSHLGM